MSFIAAYWWVWLLGLVACTAFAAWRWFGKFMGTAKRVATITQIGLDTYNANPDQRVNVLGQRAIQTAQDEAKGWVREFVLTLIASVLSWVFGVLLLIAVVIHLIDYYKS